MNDYAIYIWPCYLFTIIAFVIHIVWALVEKQKIIKTLSAKSVEEKAS